MEHSKWTFPDAEFLTIWPGCSSLKISYSKFSENKNWQWLQFRTTANFCTCHDNTVVVACAKFCSYYLITFWMRQKIDLCKIWNLVIELGVDHQVGSVWHVWHVETFTDASARWLPCNLSCVNQSEWQVPVWQECARLVFKIPNWSRKKGWLIRLTSEW